MSAVILILSATILFFAEGLRLQGSSTPLVAQLGGVLQLPCAVDTPIPLDELEVEWRRTGSTELVHLFQGGQSRPESQSYLYNDRAYFFTETEIDRGNYSLLLRNLTADDAGSYICRVYTKEENAEILVEIEAIERLVLTGLDQAVTAHVGEEVILNCFVDSHILPDQVSWMKVDSDTSSILVLLFQDNETYPDSADASYQGRTEFFNAEIPKGNFSLRLKDVRTEDKGVYMCEAHSGHLSANTTVTLQGLGLSSLHMLVLALCCSAIIVALVLSAVILSKGTEVVMKGKVLYDYAAADDDELDLVDGQTIEILQKVDEGWYLGKHIGRQGLFPSNYIQEISSSEGTEKVMKGKVLYDYAAADDDELDLVDGQTIEILQKVDEGWYFGKHIDKQGLFPSNYIQEISSAKDVSQRVLRMHYVLVFVPSIFMFTAFVLWGVIEGFLGEVVTCSTLNLIRFILLFKTSTYEEKLPEIIKTIIQTGFVFEYFIVVSVLYFVIFFNVWSIEGESKNMAFMGIMYGSSLHMGIQSFFAGGGLFMEMMDLFYLFTVSFLSRTFNDSAFIGMFVGVAVTVLSTWIVNAIVDRNRFLMKSDLFCLVLRSYYLVRRLIISIVIFYFFYQILENNEELAGLLSVTALFHLLSLAGLLDFASKPAIADIETLALILMKLFQPKETPKTILYMYGAVSPLAINATCLATELMLKSSKGARTIADLRVVVLPFECVFVLGWIVLWCHAYWKKKQEGAKNELVMCKRHGCRLWIKGLKGDSTLSKDCQMTEMTHQSPPAGSNTEQGLKGDSTPSKDFQMTEMTHPSPPAESNAEQGNPQEPPSEAKVDIHVPGYTPAEPDEIKAEECPHSNEAAAESINPLGQNVDSERYADGSAPEDISTSPLLEDNDAVSKTLLSHGEREPETNPKESRHDSITEHMESSPLLQEDMAKSVPHSESD